MLDCRLVIREPSPSRLVAEATGSSSLRAEQKELTRRRIIAAARQCFVDSGVAEASFNEIARRAGVSRATVYLHFAGKDALLVAILADDWEAQRRLFAAVPRPDRADFRKALVDWLLRMQRAYRARTDSFGLYSKAIAHDQHSASLMRDQRHALMAELARWLPMFDLSGADARHRVRAHLVLARIETFCLLSLEERWDEEVLPGAEIVADDIIALLNTSPARV